MSGRMSSLLQLQSLLCLPDETDRCQLVISQQKKSSSGVQGELISTNLLPRVAALPTIHVTLAGELSSGWVRTKISSASEARNCQQ